MCKQSLVQSRSAVRWPHSSHTTSMRQGYILIKTQSRGTDPNSPHVNPDPHNNLQSNLPRPSRQSRLTTPHLITTPLTIHKRAIRR